jgi:hypothetical protein
MDHNAFPSSHKDPRVVRVRSVQLLRHHLSYLEPEFHSASHPSCITTSHLAPTEIVPYEWRNASHLLKFT